MQYQSTLKAKLIYVFTISDTAHQGCVKIGEATLDEATSVFLQPDCKELNAAARRRIDQYTKTAGIQYKLHHTELTMYISGGHAVSFNDKEVHNVLIRSGIRRHDFSAGNQGSEWFECSVETALKAITAVKEGRAAISSDEVVPVRETVEFRPEQQEAIDRTVEKFGKGGKAFLWNAKMRFGKTLSALQVVRTCGYRRTLILTHRPVVNEGWFEDFGKIFTLTDGWAYGSRLRGERFASLEKRARKDPGFKYVYFASMQDLRGAEVAGGKFDKNLDIFKADYDLLIIDEAHEGTRTTLGQNVITLLAKERTHILNLSGTPFNLLEDYKEDEIYTWDYVMEQKAKEQWELNHFGDPNPYAGLPRLNIFTFDLGTAVGGFEDIEDKAFNFTEFFRTWSGDPEKDNRPMPEGMEGRFVHENSVRSFLDLIVKYDEKSQYPFSTPAFRRSFRHTLWMVPGVSQARALSALLQAHPIFGQFRIVNVAGDGDEDVPDDDALRLVQKAMGDNPEETMTITLSCGKLTTGVSVKPWTAVMHLAGSHNTDAKAYMQTIFRVQTPYVTASGHRKENCYVFDFAPDRTLKVLAAAARVGERDRSTATGEDRRRLGEFLNFCPVIGYNGTRMEQFDVERMLEELKKAYISRVTKNGCDDPRLYNMEMLRTLDRKALEKFQNLHKIIGATKANHSTDSVDMAKNGLTDEQYREVEKLRKKKKAKLTEEQKKALEEAREKKKNADAAISILRGISIRLPLLMYGAELKDEGQDITLENFAELIDDQSWEEFMPRGVTKELFREFVPYYDPDMFRAVSRSYRDLVRDADRLAPMERVKAVSSIFEYFRNPDKETVLTPWRVVNMHIGDCMGGHVFFDEDTTTRLAKPRFVDRGEVTRKVFRDPDTRILEINSKTGLYPLYMAYSVFAEKLQAYRDSHMLATDVPLETQNEIWDGVLRNNIFVICKTEMAKSITRRTLRGFRDAKVNARYFEDLINKITNQKQLFLDKVAKGKSYWKNTDIEDNMKFNAIVGNPPYQVSDGGGSKGISASPVYHQFVQIAMKFYPQYISMITPSRWYAGGKGLDDYRKMMLHDKRLSVLTDFPKSRDCFSSADIAGGVSFFLWDSTHSGNCLVTTSIGGEKQTNERDLCEFNIFIRSNIGAGIVRKVIQKESSFYDSRIFSNKPFGLRTYIRGKTKPFPGSIIVHSSEGKGYISRDDITKNSEYIDSFKVSIGLLDPDRAGVNSSDGRNVITKVRCIGPKEVLTETYIVLDAFSNSLEAERCANYFRTKMARMLISLATTTLLYSKECFQFVPLQDWSKPWTDAELYAKYNLSSEEIAYIESMIKPMPDSTLFDDDELIDGNYGSFSLFAHGVKAGDRIVYTPTGAELTVIDDSTVEYDGEQYSLAQFTAKFMPENGVSRSGVCKGPKYFSFNGVSLYRLKESFLKE